MKWLESSGTIELTRSDSQYSASFSIIESPLPGLIAYLPLLHEVERNYYDTLKADMRRSSYLLGRLAAKTALSVITGSDTAQMASFYIDFGVFKFPVVKSFPHQNRQVSISHCQNIGIALAFPEEHPLGIDIEKIDPDKMAVLEGFITPKDNEQFAGIGLNTLVGYTLMWTVKESLSKIIRTGLTMDPGIMEVKSFERVGEFYISTFSHWPQYKSISFQCGEYVCSVTLPRKTTPALDRLVQGCLAICERH
jgi:phosphopantetheinyl transferase